MSPELDSLGEFIAPWVRIAENAVRVVEQQLQEKSPALRQRACELASILISLENLLSFPWIAAQVEKGALFLHGWYFDLEHGDLLGYVSEKKAFEPIVARCASRAPGA